MIATSPQYASRILVFLWCDHIMQAVSCGNPGYTFSNDLQFGVKLNIEANSRNIYKETHQQYCIDCARLFNN